jgi:hypothetical protein
MKKLIWFLICISLISCRSQGQHNSHISQIESNINIDESGNEIFDSFYTYFVEDSIFQKDRTIYPETVTSPEYIDAAGFEHDSSWYVGDLAWEYISIKNTTEVKIQGDTASIVGEVWTNSSLNLFESEFYIKDGQWYLDLTTNKNKDFLYRLFCSM